MRSDDATNIASRSRGAAVGAPATAELVNENPLVAVPDGYKIDVRYESAKMRVNEMVPLVETVHDWVEIGGLFRVSPVQKIMQAQIGQHHQK